MSFRYAISVSLLVVLCVACAAPADNSADSADRPSILTGNAQALWLVSSDADGRYGVVVRPAGESWKWVDRNIAPQKLAQPPAAGVAIGGQLHLILAEPRAYQIYTPEGNRTIATYPSHERWPEGASPLALCTAEGLNDAGAGSMAAIVPLGQTQTATAPSEDQEQPATTPAEAGGDAQKGLSLGAFQRRQGQWQWLGDIDARPAADGAVFATVADGRMYVLLSPAEDGRNRLFVSADENAWRELALAEPAVDAYALGMTTLAQRPRMVLVVTADDEPDLRRVVLAAVLEDGNLSIQPVRIDQDDLTVASDDQPSASRLGDRIAILTRRDGQYELVTCETNGRAIPQGLLDIFDEPPPDTTGEALMRYFMWGIAIAMFLPLVLLRPKSPAGMFSLPETLRPGSLAKRLAAAVIDALPFYLLGGALMLTQVPFEKLREVKNIWTIAQEYAMTAGSAYVLISVILLYVGYCTFMELRFSATLGKMALGLKVCGDKGERPDLRGVLLRNISKIIETLWLMPVPVLLLWPLFNPNRQRIGDVLGRTAVVDAREVAPPAQTAGEQDESPHEQGPRTPPPPPDDKDKPQDE